MNKKEFFTKVRDQIWYFQLHGWQNLKMGHELGILAIAFEDNGQLSFPNKMAFLPDYRIWSWNENEQLLYLMSPQKEVKVTLEAPEDESVRTVMHEQDSSNTFVANTSLESEMYFLWSPEPLVQRMNETSVNEQPTLIYAGAAQDRHTDTLMGKVVGSQYKFNDVDFWRFCYEWLINHPLANPVAIAEDKKLSGDVWMRYANEDKLIVNEDYATIISPRSLFLDFLGELNFRNTTQRISGNKIEILPQIQKLLVEYFIDRMQVMNGDKKD